MRNSRILSNTLSSTTTFSSLSQPRPPPPPRSAASSSPSPSTVSDQYTNPNYSIPDNGSESNSYSNRNNHHHHHNPTGNSNGNNNNTFLPLPSSSSLSSSVPQPKKRTTLSTSGMNALLGPLKRMLPGSGNSTSNNNHNHTNPGNNPGNGNNHHHHYYGNEGTFAARIQTSRNNNYSNNNTNDRRQSNPQNKNNNEGYDYTDEENNDDGDNEDNYDYGNNNDDYYDADQPLPTNDLNGNRFKSNNNNNDNYGGSGNYPTTTVTTTKTKALTMNHSSSSMDNSLNITNNRKKVYEQDSRRITSTSSSGRRTPTSVADDPDMEEKHSSSSNNNNNTNHPEYSSQRYEFSSTNPKSNASKSNFIRIPSTVNPSVPKARSTVTNPSIITNNLPPTTSSSRKIPLQHIIENDIDVDSIVEDDMEDNDDDGTNSNDIGDNNDLQKITGIAPPSGKSNGNRIIRKKSVNRMDSSEFLSPSVAGKLRPPNEKQINSNNNGKLDTSTLPQSSSSGSTVNPTPSPPQNYQNALQKQLIRTTSALLIPPPNGPSVSTGSNHPHTSIATGTTIPSLSENTITNKSSKTLIDAAELVPLQTKITEQEKIIQENNVTIQRLRKQLMDVTNNFKVRIDAVENGNPVWSKQLDDFITQYENTTKKHTNEWIKGRTRNIRSAIELEVKKVSVSYENKLRILADKVTNLEAQSLREMASRFGSTLLAFLWNGVILFFSAMVLFFRPLKYLWESIQTPGESCARVGYHIRNLVTCSCCRCRKSKGKKISSYDGDGDNDGGDSRNDTNDNDEDGNGTGDGDGYNRNNGDSTHYRSGAGTLRRYQSLRRMPPNNTNGMITQNGYNRKTNSMNMDIVNTSSSGNSGTVYPDALPRITKTTSHNNTQKTRNMNSIGDNRSENSFRSEQGSLSHSVSRDTNTSSLNMNPLSYELLNHVPPQPPPSSSFTVQKMKKTGGISFSSSTSSLPYTQIMNENDIPVSLPEDTGSVSNTTADNILPPSNNNTGSTVSVKDHSLPKLNTARGDTLSYMVSPIPLHKNKGGGNWKGLLRKE